MVWDMVQGQGEQEQQLRSELSMEKAQMRRQHERELKALSDKMADEQVLPRPSPSLAMLLSCDLSSYDHVCGGKLTCRAPQLTRRYGCCRCKTACYGVDSWPHDIYNNNGSIK